MDIRPTDLVVLKNGQIRLACKYSDGAIYLCHPARPHIALYLYDKNGKPLDRGVLGAQSDEEIIRVISKADKLYEDIFIKYVYLEKE